jgi:hypothetical protein
MEMGVKKKAQFEVRPLRCGFGQCATWTGRITIQPDYLQGGRGYSRHDLVETLTHELTHLRGKRYEGHGTPFYRALGRDLHQLERADGLFRGIPDSPDRFVRKMRGTPLHQRD